MRDERLEQAAHDLALLVRKQLLREERQRKLNDPFVLPIRWTNSEDMPTDNWQTVRGDAAVPLDLTGSANLIDTFAEVPTHRLVLLGGAGAGKTILAERLALALVNAREPTSTRPVPVVFSLSAWEPTTPPAEESLRLWMAEQMAARYDGMNTTGGPHPDIALALIENGYILPILDGFDEIAPALQSLALGNINRSLNAGEPVLLTSRQDQYSDAARLVDCGRGLHGAGVVEIQDLTLSDLEAYLPLTTGPASKKWEPVFECMRND